VQENKVVRLCCQHFGHPLPSLCVCVCVCVCVLFFRRRGVMGSVCVFYISYHESWQGRGSYEATSSSSVLTSCKNARCHSGVVSGAVATRKPTLSFHVWYKEKNGNKKWNDVCGGTCKTVYFKWKEDSSVLCRPARDGNLVLIWK
jgi:hypothetical protein